MSRVQSDREGPSTRTLFEVPRAASPATLLRYQSAYVEKIRTVLLIRGAGRAGAPLGEDIRSRLGVIDRELADLEREHHIPFAFTCAAIGLDEFERDCLATIVAPHLDHDVREAIAHFWGMPTRRYVDSALLLSLFLDDRRERIARAAQLKDGSKLHAAGLVEAAATALPHASTHLEQELVATPRLLRLFEGAFGLDPRYSGIARLLAVEPSAAVGVVDRARHDELAAMIAGAHDAFRGGAAVVMLSGPPGAGKVRLARALAAVDAKQLLVVETSQLPTEPARLSKTITALAHEAELLSARLLLRRVDSFASDARLASHLRHALASTPFRVWCTSDVDPSRIDAPNVAELALLRVSIGFPDVALRRDAWRQDLSEIGILIADDDVRALASDYPLSRSAIEASARLARTLTTSGGDPCSVLPKVAETQMHGQLGRFAKRSRSLVRLRDVVMPDSTREQVGELYAALRHRTSVMDRWGMTEKHALGRGIVALFNGPPGTGKTLTASALANELALPLYRIDVSSVVDKFIGETEKNLVRIFDEAAASRAALLFDEADSLFGKRLEAKDSTDRYANMQVNLLLNLIEDYDGFVVLTTNLKGALDDAFLRRIIYKIVFDKPEYDELVALWEYHLPGTVLRADDVDTEALADEFSQLSGGDIKNAVLRATLATSGNEPVTQETLRRAVINELRANGNVVAG